MFKDYQNQNLPPLQRGSLVTPTRVHNLLTEACVSAANKLKRISARRRLFSSSVFNGNSIERQYLQFIGMHMEYRECECDIVRGIQIRLAIKGEVFVNEIRVVDSFKGE